MSVEAFQLFIKSLIIHLLYTNLYFLTFLTIIAGCLQFFPVNAACSFCTCLTRPDTLSHNCRSYQRAFIIAQNNKLRLFQASPMGSIEFRMSQKPPTPCNSRASWFCWVHVQLKPAISHVTQHVASSFQLQILEICPLVYPKCYCCPRLCKYHPKHFSFFVVIR